MHRVNNLLKVYSGKVQIMSQRLISDLKFPLWLKSLEDLFFPTLYSNWLANFFQSFLLFSILQINKWQFRNKNSFLTATFFECNCWNACTNKERNFHKILSIRLGKSVHRLWLYNFGNLLRLSCKWGVTQYNGTHCKSHGLNICRQHHSITSVFPLCLHLFNLRKRCFHPHKL